MGQSTLILLVVLIIAVLGRANSVAVAAGILLFTKLLHGERYLFPLIEKNGISCGLILLTTAILIPIAKGNVTFQNLQSIFMSPTGLVALVLSLFTTYLSGQGLQYLNVQGHVNVLPALIVGSVIAATFLGGVPVGPLIASGMLALVLKLLNLKI